MGTAISNALAFAPWHGFREFRHMSHNETIFLVVAGMAVLALVVVAIKRRRRRWYQVRLR
jgi:LPXTG-motif cell wall-anchored protein